MRHANGLAGWGVLCLVTCGCMSPFHTDRGAFYGGVTGAGLGALAGSASGNTAAGAIIGAGVGTLTGAAVGNSLDEMEARNRALIEARLARPLPPGGATVDDVIAMHRAGVDPVTVTHHIQANGTARPLQPADLIRMQQEGVPSSVVQALQSAPIAASTDPHGLPTTPIYVPAGPPPIIIESYPPPWRPPHRPYRWHHRHW